MNELKFEIQPSLTDIIYSWLYLFASFDMMINDWESSNGKQRFRQLQRERTEPCSYNEENTLSCELKSQMSHAEKHILEFYLSLAHQLKLQLLSWFL